MKCKFKFWFVLVVVLPFKIWAQDTLEQNQKKDLQDVARSVFGQLPFSKSEQSQRDSERVYFSIIPAFASAGSEQVFVTSFMTAFYLGSPKTTNLSNVYFTPYITLSEQYVFPMRSYIWTKNNKLNFIGDYRFMKYPQWQYNINHPSEINEESRLNYYQTRFYQTMSYSVQPYLAVGLGVQYDYYAGIQEDNKEVTGLSSYQQYGDTNTRSFHSGGPTLELIFDNRGNTINPQKGNYLRVSCRNNSKIFGSKNLWNSIYIDAKKYIPINLQKNQIIAFWVWYWSILGGKPNYLDLPSNGWDNYGRSGRGLYRNKYRSSGLIYSEVEFRSNLSANGLWGMVAFLNFTSPAVLFTQEYHSPFIGAGTGVRLLLDKRSGTKCGLDVGFSKSYWGVYLTLNEYF